MPESSCTGAGVLQYSSPARTTRYLVSPILSECSPSVNSIFIIKRTPTNIVGVLSIFGGTVKNLSPSTLQIIKDLYFGAYVDLSSFI